MTEATRTVFDPFHGKNVEISDHLTDRLRGKYACGPMLENGDPEFGWRQMEPTSINLEAAAEIERLQGRVAEEIASLESAISDVERLQARVKELEEATEGLLRAVCGDTGFAEAVRFDSGRAYPWPALDIAEEKARAVLQSSGDALPPERT